ncbi:cupin domain-containing protein [Catenulispora pinisilvae]|uniref:cupin domain-containing protein n=1 Tax=Catenulispora pinisilvae TaxID=2705253 RepID=UPI00189213DF|nr:cupin domain-containing protein [Catenulispora pinisilvae]
MTTTEPVVGRLGGDFLAQAFRRRHQVFPGAAHDVSDLLTWEALNEILASQRLESPRLRLAVGGSALDQGGYTTATTSRRGVRWHRLNTGEFNRRLAEGATLVLDAVDEMHPPIRALAAALEEMFHTSAQANAYASWRPESGFRTHWDDHDTIIVQLDGAKSWRLFGLTRPAPLHLDTELPEEPTGEPIDEFVLSAGDVLYVPRGHWHDVAAVPGQRSLHLTFGLGVTTGVDLLTFLADDLRGTALFREDLPILSGPQEQAAYLDMFRKQLIAELERPDLLLRFAAHADGTESARTGLSLPFVDGVPADASLTMRLLTPRALLHESEENRVQFEAGGQSWTFAAAAWGVLEALADGEAWSLGELAHLAGLKVDLVADLASELVGHGVAQVLPG